MASESKTFYPEAHNEADYSYGSISGGANPVGKGSSNTESYARIRLNPGSRATTHIRWPFDCSAIPEGATIDSVSCTAAASISSTSSSYITNRTMQLHSGTTAKGSATNIVGTTIKVHTLACGAWTRDELQNCNLYIYAARGTSGTSASIEIKFYGADLTVQYTCRSEKFMLKLGGSYNDVARVFKKTSGIWIEQTDLANVVLSEKGLINGGEWVNPVQKHTVTITGAGDATYAYVTINGVKYTAPATVEVADGDVIQATISYSAKVSGEITVNEETVASGKATHNYTVLSDCTISLSVHSSGAGSISITTS